MPLVYDWNALKLEFMRGSWTTTEAFRQEKGIVLEKEKRELQAVVSNLKTFDSDAVHASVEVGALVQASREGREAFYFIVASFGGDSFKVQGKTVFTLSQESPLGQALLGKKQGDKVIVEIPDGKLMLKILSIS